nr:PTS glucitol/sorbitol transporter subunit IIA [Propionicimonas sp.]
MTQPIWRSSVVHIGSDAAELFEAGVFILFGQPVPDALAEVSLVHCGPESEFQPIQVGDRLWIGNTSMRIDEVGSMANGNFRQLGHIVVYLNVGDADLLPGAVKASGDVPVPAVGDQIAVHRDPEA